MSVSIGGGQLRLTTNLTPVRISRPGAIQGTNPSLFLDFLSGVLAPGIDFTRTSGGGYFGPDGLFRFTPASRNLLLQTQEFDSASWSKSGANVYPFDPAMATFGPELVTNGTLNSATAWSVINWVISGGVATITNANDSLTQTVSLVSGRFYKVTYTVTAFSGTGGVRPRFFGGPTVSGTTVSAPGQYTEYMLALPGNTQVAIATTTNTCTVSVDNISVREVIGGLIATPDGTLTADALIESVGASAHQISQSASGGLVAGQPYALSIYAKLGAGSRFLQLRFASGGVTGDPRANFDLLTGTYDVSAGHSASITPVGDGWYRCAFVVASVTGASSAVAFNLASSLLTAFAPSYTGDGASSIYLWGAQLELGSTPTDYTRNVGGLYPPRFDYDPVTLAPRGLLIEEQRTNLLLRSEEFENAAWDKSSVTVTANSAVSPDGIVDADKLVEAAANVAHYVFQGISSGISDNATFTASVYVKAAERTEVRLEGRRKDGTFWGATFDLSAGTLAASSNVVGTPTIEPVGNGWFRISASFNSLAGAGTPTFAVLVISGGVTTYLGDGTSGIYVWGAQLEAGAFATSYIPTAASQVTRTADVAAVTRTNFSRWYNQSEGTFVVEADTTVAVSTNVYRSMSVSDSTTANCIYTFQYNTNWGGIGVVGSVTQFDRQPIGSYTSGVPAKVAMAYKANDFAVSVGGSAPLTDNAGAVPAVSQMNIGSLLGTNQINGHIRRIRYYPTRLSNAQLQALTA